MATIDHSVFSKRIADIAIDLGLVSPADQQRMHEVQARAITLRERGAELPTIRDLNDDNHWLKIQQALGITDAAVDAARAQTSGANPIAVEGVPPAGAVLGELNAIDPVVKDILLAAQASEKALTALQYAKELGASYDSEPQAELNGKSSFQQRLDAINGQLDFAHLGRPGESPLVESAQRVHKTALQFEALEHHVDCAKNEGQDPEFAKLRHMLASTLPQQVATTYRASAIALGLRAEQLAQQNHPQAMAVANAADSMLNMLSTQLNIAPPTADEIAQLRGTHTNQHTAPETEQAAKTAAGLNQTTKSFVDAEQHKRGSAPDAPSTGMAV